MAKHSGVGNNSKVKKLEVVHKSKLCDVEKMDYLIESLREHVENYMNCNEEWIELNFMYQKIIELELWWETWNELE